MRFTQFILVLFSIFIGANVVGVIDTRLFIEDLISPVDGAYNYELGASYSPKDLVSEGFVSGRPEKRGFFKYTQNLNEDPMMSKISLYLDSKNDLYKIKLYSKTDKSKQEYKSIFKSILLKKYESIIAKNPETFKNYDELFSGKNTVSVSGSGLSAILTYERFIND